VDADENVSGGGFGVGISSNFKLRDRELVTTIAFIGFSSGRISEHKEMVSSRRGKEN